MPRFHLVDNERVQFTVEEEAQFSSRADLESEIEKLTEEVEEATKSKDFRKQARCRKSL